VDFNLFLRETGNEGLDYSQSCFLGKQNDQETEDFMVQTQETSSKYVGMSCDFQRLSEFINNEQIIFIVSKGEYNPILKKEVSAWK
jgi:hypothetical protein